MRTADKTLLKVRDLDGKTHFIRKEYYEDKTRTRLGRYRIDGTPLGRGCMDAPAIHRENIKDVIRGEQ